MFDANPCRTSEVSPIEPSGWIRGQNVEEDPAVAVLSASVALQTAVMRAKPSIPASLQKSACSCQMQTGL